jgi:hypothetical protein
VHYISSRLSIPVAEGDTEHLIADLVKMHGKEKEAELRQKIALEPLERLKIKTIKEIAVTPDWSSKLSSCDTITYPLAHALVKAFSGRTFRSTTPVPRDGRPFEWRDKYEEKFLVAYPPQSFEVDVEVGSKHETAYVSMTSFCQYIKVQRDETPNFICWRNYGKAKKTAQAQIERVLTNVAPHRYRDYMKTAGLFIPFDLDYMQCLLRDESLGEPHVACMEKWKEVAGVPKHEPWFYGPAFNKINDYLIKNWLNVSNRISYPADDIYHETKETIDITRENVTKDYKLYKDATKVLLSPNSRYIRAQTERDVDIVERPPPALPPLPADWRPLAAGIVGPPLARSAGNNT